MLTGKKRFTKIDGFSCRCDFCFRKRFDNKGLNGGVWGVKMGVYKEPERGGKRGLGCVRRGEECMKIKYFCDSSTATRKGPV